MLIAFIQVLFAKISIMLNLGKTQKKHLSGHLTHVNMHICPLLSGILLMSGISQEHLLTIH